VSEPRFAWRGVMLDVARHFFGPDEVKRFVDLIARLGFNRLHLHLTDDQGWRLEIRSWPRLAKIGGAGAVGGAPGGWYSQEQYASLVEYAAGRGVVVVPEIDLPGHVNAALVAYPELAPRGYEPAPYTGVGVGFSSLDVASDRVREFVADVVGELAALTPGPHIHIGGDEAAATPHDGYVAFVERTCAVVRASGKQPIGWEEIARTALEPGTIVQHWRDPELAREAVRRGCRVLMSPAARTYLDHKYDETTKLGTQWAAGRLTLRDAYEWDPASLVAGVGEADVVGVEAAIWTETLASMGDVELMAFPRLLALADVASAPPGERSWDAFRETLPAGLAELDALGVQYARVDASA
jgi:hexosaminidase